MQDMSYFQLFFIYSLYIYVHMTHRRTTIYLLFSYLKLFCIVSVILFKSSLLQDNLFYFSCYLVSVYCYFYCLLFTVSVYWLNFVKIILSPLTFVQLIIFISRVIVIVARWYSLHKKLLSASGTFLALELQNMST